MADTKNDIRNSWAVVTGASSGLGSHFARQLAARGVNVVAAARRADRLEALKSEIESAHGTRVMPVVVDLAGEAGAEKLYSVVREAGLEPLILVNNAGFGFHGHFLDVSWERERSMLSLDIASLVYLTRRFASDMVERGRGFILQVASVAAYQSAPTYASYAAAKAYVLHHGEAIHHELRRSGVSVTVVCPGVTATEFQAVAGQPPNLYQKVAMMDGERVARIGIRSLLRRRLSVVPGLFNKVSVWLNRVIPRGIMVRLADRVMR